MKRTIRLISLLLTVILMISALASCNNAANNSSTDSDETLESTEVGTENGLDGKITVFDNKEYLVKIIRHELADTAERDYYNKIRELFKKRTNKAVSNATDFVTSGQALDNGAAILFGETDYPESAQIYSEITANQAVAKVVGNKYVIAYRSVEALTELLVKLEALINKSPSSKIIINSSWNIEVSVTGIVDVTELPSYNGKNFDSVVSSGQGSRVQVKKNTNEAEFNSYLLSLESSGYTKYTTNEIKASEEIGSNLFATYTSDKYIVHTMYLPATKTVSVMIDSREIFGLAGLESENVYTNTDNKSTTFTQLGLAQIPGATANGMGYIVKLTDGRFVVVDGGYAYESSGGGSSGDFLLNTMKKLADDPENIVIAAWFITHIHTDHAGGFMGMGNKHAKDVVIEKLIYNQPNDDQMASAGLGDRTKWISTGIENFKKANNPIKTVIKAHPGQQFFLCDLTITMLGTMDLLEPYTLTSGNNSSLVMMLEMNGGRVLLTGDCEPAEGRAIRDIYGGIDNTESALKCDFIQLSHHGYGNTKTESNPDRSALNVMSQAPYALIPVAYTKLAGSPGGYEDSVKHMTQNNIWDEEHRIIAHDINVTIEFKTDGTIIIGDGSYVKGEGWKT